MREIGGYLELELPENKEFHDEAISLNSGRNALKYILIIRKYTKMFIPKYYCDVILEPINDLNIEIEYYNIDSNFEAVFDFSKIEKDHGFLYINYFGLKDEYIHKISLATNLIIDNVQAFFRKSLRYADSFNSARKFFGVSDGAYLYLNSPERLDINVDKSLLRFEHLIKRIENSARDGYAYYQKNERNISDIPLMRMSNITKRILSSIDYEKVIKKRIHNFEMLHSSLGQKNMLNSFINSNRGEFVYPFMTLDTTLKEKLISNLVFVPTFWPNVLNNCNFSDIEFNMANNIICLPIDQRIEKSDLDKIIKLITS